jgi:hypothetical protein
MAVRIAVMMRMVAPDRTWEPWNPVKMKNEAAN